MVDQLTTILQYIYHLFALQRAIIVRKAIIGSIDATFDYLCAITIADIAVHNHRRNAPDDIVYAWISNGVQRVQAVYPVPFKSYPGSLSLRDGALVFPVV
jgi:hypothetical protein